MEAVRIVVLGAPQVGKSTLVKQFVQCSPCEVITAPANSNTNTNTNTTAKNPCRAVSPKSRHSQASPQSNAVNHLPTPLPHPLPRQTYFPAVILENRLYTFRLHDLPHVPQFPDSGSAEWLTCCGAGVRSASAYLLVFDLTAPETFAYVRNLRRQMMASRSMHRVPVVVVGNKRDRLGEKLARSAAGSTLGSTAGGIGSGSGANTACSSRDLQTVVRKLWKWSYIECSALYNCRVQQVFKELTSALGALEEDRSSFLPASTSSVATRQEQDHVDKGYKSSISFSSPPPTENTRRNQVRSLSFVSLCSKCNIL